MINLTFDARSVVKAVKSMTVDVDKQMRFALQQTLNRTAEARQKNIRREITSKMKIRKGVNLFREIVRFAREDRADRKLDRMRATVRIMGTPQLGAERDKYRRIGALVLRQSQGGTQRSSAIYRTTADKLSVQGFAIPAPGLRGPGKAMALALYPHNIGVSLHRRPDGGAFFANSYKGGRVKRGARKGQFKKQTRFFFVKEGVGIFMREQVGSHSETDAVWFFRRQITLPRRVRLEETFNNGLDTQLQRTFDREFANAMRTAKPIATAP